MKSQKLKNKKGFVLLFAVVLASILLAITLGVSDIALKETQFGTSAKDTSDALYAADAGVECALFNDKTTSNSFVYSGGTGTVDCLGRSVPMQGNSFPNFSFILSGLGPDGHACAKVQVNKTIDDSITPPAIISTQILSLGYNKGSGDPDKCIPGSTGLERSLELNY